MDSKLKYPARSPPEETVHVGAEATDVFRDRYEEAVEGAPPLHTEEDDGLGTSSSIELGAEFVCFRTKHILRRSAALGRRASGGVVSPGDDLVRAGDACPDSGDADVGSGLSGRCGLQEAARPLGDCGPPSSGAGASGEPGEAEARRGEALFLRVALRSSDRARCSAGVERRGGGVGGEPALPPNACSAGANIGAVRKEELLLLAEMALLAAAAGDDGRPRDDGERTPPSMRVAERELTSDRRSHCTAASRCHGNLGSPCWQLMSRAEQ